MIHQVVIKEVDGGYVAGFEGGSSRCGIRPTPQKALRAWLDHVWIWLKVYADRTPHSAYRRESVGSSYAEKPIGIGVLVKELGLPTHGIRGLLAAENLEEYGDL